MGRPKVAKYRLVSQIGRGGMGEVWRAEQLGAGGFRRMVAVKCIAAGEAARTEMFVREAKIAAELQHPNVVSVFDFERDDAGALFLVMELVDGVDLRQLSRAGALEIEDVVFVVSRILRALDYAHSRERPIVHRDVTPHNVLISRGGAVKLSDFGLARAEASLGSDRGRVVGTAGYLAPEQIQGASLDGRADLFSVGVILYELLTGLLPFGEGFTRQTLLRVLSWDPVSPGQLVPGVPATLEAVTLQLLAKDRDERFGTAGEALRALGPVSDRSPALGARVQSCLTEGRTRAPARKRRLFGELTTRSARRSVRRSAKTAKSG